MSWTPPPPPGSENISNAATGNIPPEPPSPVAPLPSTKPKSKKLWIGLAVSTVIALAGFWFYSNHIDVPQLPEIRKLVEGQLSQPDLSVKSVSVKNVSRKGNNLEMAYTAVVELTTAKYAGVATGKYLSDHGADPSIAQQIQNILARRDSKDILAEAQMGTLPADLEDKTLVKQVMAAGKTITYTGQITATRGNNGWVPKLAGPPQASENLPSGRGLSQFSGEVLDVDKPENAGALNQLVKSANPDSLQKLKSAVARIQKKQLAKYLESFQPGTLFKGTATMPNGDVQVLYLEISKLDIDRQIITAALRNDGGWDDFRRLQGTYLFDADKPDFSLKLNTRSEQVIQNCGPFLDWQGDYEIQFVPDDEMGLTASLQCWMGRYELKFKRVAADQKANVIADATDTQQKWLAATKAGARYQVVATLPNQAWSRNYYFTFTKQERNGASAVIEGLLLDPRNGWRKAFSGMLVLNNYRADGKHLRIVGAGHSRTAEEQDGYSPFAAYDFTWYPQLDDGRFTFDSREGQYWHLEFTPFSGNIPAPGVENDSPGQIPSQTSQMTALQKASSSDSFTWKNQDGSEVVLPKAAQKNEVNTVDSKLGTFYFKPTGAIPKVTGDNPTFIHKGIAIDLSGKFMVEGFDNRFIFFKLGNGNGILTPAQYSGVLNTEYRIDPTSRKLEFDSGHMFGIGKTTIKYDAQDLDAQTQQCTITSKLPSGVYAVMVYHGFFIFEYVAPPKN